MREVRTLKSGWATSSDEYKVLSFTNGGIIRIITILHKGWGKAYERSGTQQSSKEGIRHRISTQETWNLYISPNWKFTAGRSDQQKVATQIQEG